MTVQFNLKGKTALVTGSASGIGLATVELLARSGAKVALNHLPDDPRGPAEVDRLRKGGLDVISAPGNVAKPDEPLAMMNRAVAELGRLDLLVNNAGTPSSKQRVPMKSLDLLTEDVWTEILETNLLGTVRCTKAAADALRVSRGAVVNLASIAGINSAGSSMAYGASKAAIIKITKDFARALAPEARVNAVAPGVVATPWAGLGQKERLAASGDCALLKRLATPQEIAELIVYLGMAGSFITGQTVVIDGGLTLAEAREYAMAAQMNKAL